MSRSAAGVACLVLSCVFYAALLAVPFLPLGNPGQAAVAAGLVVAGEGIFLVGCLLAGRELMARYRHRLNPRSWFTPTASPPSEPKGPDS